MRISDWSSDVCSSDLHAFEASVLAQPAIGLAVAIFFVAGNRMPKMRGMHANLVGAPGFDTHLGIAVPTAALDQLEVTDRILALGIDPHHALAAGQYRFLQRHVHGEA